MVAAASVPNVFVIDNAIKQSETNVSLIIYCLRLFVVHKHVYNVAGSEVIVGDTCVPSVIVIGTAINQLERNVSPIKICYCL